MARLSRMVTVCLGLVVAKRETFGFRLPRVMVHMVYSCESGREKLGQASFGGEQDLCVTERLVCDGVSVGEKLEAGFWSFRFR